MATAHLQSNPTTERRLKAEAVVAVGQPLDQARQAYGASYGRADAAVLAEAVGDAQSEPALV